jgi:hypothetical protein
MTLEIKVGPPQLAVHQGYTVMISDPDGQILQEGDRGLYFLDTRLISSYALFADGVPWTFLNGGALAASAARVYCTNPPIRTAAGMIPERTLGLVFGRHIDVGMHEDIDITNYGPEPVCLNLELAIRSDFADLFEVKGKTVTRKGEVRTDWSADRQELTTTYRHADFSRALRVTAGDQHSPMAYANGRLSFVVELPARGRVAHQPALCICRWRSMERRTRLQRRRLHGFGGYPRPKTVAGERPQGRVV